MCKVLKDMKLYNKTLKVIVKNDSKDKKKGRKPAKPTSIEAFLGLEWTTS